MECTLEGESEAHKTYRSRLDARGQYKDPAFRNRTLAQVYSNDGYPFVAPGDSDDSD